MDNEKELILAYESHIIVPKNNVVNIGYVSDDQIYVKDCNGYTILNVTEKKIDYKLVCRSAINVDFTVKDCHLLIPRAKASIIQNFGEVSNVATILLPILATLKTSSKENRENM